MYHCMLGWMHDDMLGWFDAYGWLRGGNTRRLELNFNKKRKKTNMTLCEVGTMWMRGILRLGLFLHR